MSFALDPLVLAFTLAATLAAALLFGLLPAWQVTRSDTAPALKKQARGSQFLVSLQLALSLPLLAGAGLLARTVYNLQRVDLGFPAERLLVLRVDLREAGYEPPRRPAVLGELLGDFQRIPGVRAASFSQLGLFSGGESSNTIAVEGYTPAGDHDRGSAMDVVGSGYFSTLGIPIIMGREILPGDRAGASMVCVINQAFAKRFFDRRNPIGMRITSIDEDRRTTYQIVGVARNSRTKQLRGEVEPRYFVAVMAAARNATQRRDAALTIVHAGSIEEQMAPLTAQDRTTAQLAVVFGSVALTLAAIGLYGVLSYGIARRRREIAVRIALGARPGRVIAMILRETIGLLIVGLPLGGGLAYAASRLIGSQLYGVAPQDPLTMLLAVGLLLSVALSAAYLPAQRASKLDPMQALRM
jgi:hypothetical protein